MEEIKKSLYSFEGKKGKYKYWLFLCVPIFMIIMGILNLSLASRIGSTIDQTLTDFAYTWLEEIKIQKEYKFSGVFLLGMQKFNTAMLLFAGALITLINFWGLRIERKRNKELISVLKKHGEI